MNGVRQAGAGSRPRPTRWSRVTTFAHTGDPFSAQPAATAATGPAGHQHADAYQCGVGEVAATNVATVTSGSYRAFIHFGM